MKSIVSLFIALPSLLALLSPVESAGGRAAASQTPVLSARTDLVVLNVHVEQGHAAVAGLTVDRFEVFEDGAPQNLSLFEPQDAPVTAGLLIDNSSSMLPYRDRVIAAALQLARLSNPQDELFVLHFNERARYGLPEGTAFTDQLDSLRQALLRMTGLGKTALYDAVTEGLDHLEQGSRQRRALIIVSDGGDNASRRSRDEVLDRVRRGDVVIFSVIVTGEIGSGANPRVLKQLASASGGEVWAARSVRDLQPAFVELAKDIRAGYTIGYVSTNPNADGAFRKLHVVARDQRGRKLSVRVRAGYMAPGGGGISE